MSLKNKVGNYLILFGLIALLVFVASVLAPPESFDSTAFLAAAGLLVLGVAFRRSKVRPRAGGPPAGGGAGGGGGGGGNAPQGMPAKPKPARQGLFSTLLNGPASKQKTAPGGGGGPGRPAGGGGGGGKSGGGGGGSGKGGGGGGKGGPPGKGGGGGGGGGKPHK